MYYMGQDKRKKRQLARWWKQSPKCRNCGQITVIKTAGDDKQPVENTATYQHTHPVGHPERNKGTNKNTLWCYKCNREEGEEWGDWLVIQEINGITDIAVLEQMLKEESALYEYLIQDPDKIRPLRILRLMARCTEIVNRITLITEQDGHSI